MATIREIYQYLDHKAPFSLQMDFDNSGFLVGREDAAVTRVMVALDATETVIKEAVDAGCQLIVTHHPLIFHPAKSVTTTDPVGRCLLSLIENRIALICAHTNLDAVNGGVNDVLAYTLGLEDIQQLQPAGLDAEGRPYGIGRVGTVSGYSDLNSFAAFVRQALNAPGVRIVNAGKPVRKVAVGGGSCGDMYSEAIALGCDTFVTADVGYHTFLDAKTMGINLIDAGHFSTENMVCGVLTDWLSVEFPNLQVFQSKLHKEVFSCL